MYLCFNRGKVLEFKLSNKTPLFSATQIARRLAEFISVLNKEDVSRLQCQDQIVEVGAVCVLAWVVKSFGLLFWVNVSNSMPIYNNVIIDR